MPEVVIEDINRRAKLVYVASGSGTSEDPYAGLVLGPVDEVSGYIYENGSRREVKRAVIDAATSGNNTIVAAVTGKKIRVLSVNLIASGAVNVRWESGADGTALSGQMNFAANSGYVLPYNKDGWYQTAESTLLNLELSGATSVDGSITYIEAE